MFGECHAHIIMDGKNYKAAVSLHRNGPAEGPIRSSRTPPRTGNRCGSVFTFLPPDIND